jgi:P27 family predicted phage terminase small subunit
MPRRPDPDYVRQLKGKDPRIPVDQRIVFKTTTDISTIIPPDYLNREAQHHWERMALILADVGLLQEVGRDKLGRYCQAAADWEEIMTARNAMGKAKLKITEDNWRQMIYWQNQLKAAEDTMREFEREYGLTPASAAKVRRPGHGGGGAKSPQDKFKDFLDEIPRAERV